MSPDDAHSNDDSLDNSEHIADLFDSSSQIVQPALWLVATPIGNLRDITLRAVDVLRAATLICCEDTRRTGRLLTMLGIDRSKTDVKLLVANEHTEYNVVDEVLNALSHHGVVAVVTDAGTPGISDPGALLVRAAIDNNYPVLTAPGATAFVAAAIVSGLPTTHLSFDGFLPRSGVERSAQISAIATDTRTVVLYEAPHRLVRTIDDLITVCGPDRQIALCREITKMHEETWRGTLGQAKELLAVHEPRGEYVIVIAPFEESRTEITDEHIAMLLNQRVSQGSSKKSAVDEVARELGIARNRVYRISLQ
jgi:16S rRNA (cytidine1402-2'-O)-methyltransferase